MLVRVVMVSKEKQLIGFVVPGWDSEYTHYKNFHQLPDELVRSITEDGIAHAHAWATLGAENWRRFQIKDWEVWNET